MKKQTIISLLIFTILSFVKTEDLRKLVKEEDYPGIECGKKNPKKEKDCTKYGTDSGMLCCMVSDDANYKSGCCTLLSLEHAKGLNFDKQGRKAFSVSEDNRKTFSNKYWSCGNNSLYLNINIFLFAILLFLLFK